MFRKLKKEIIIYENNDFLKIKIPKRYSFGKLNNALKSLNINHEFKRKIIGSVLKYDSDIINEDKKIPALEIYFINNNSTSYEIINEDENNFIISEKVTDDKINENMIEIKNNDYLICKLVHDINGSTKSVKTYSSCNKETFSKMDKKEAFSICKKLLDNLWKNNEIKSIIDIKRLYQQLNIISYDKYNPVISDDVISLCSTQKEDNINDKMACSFNIVLNSTFEVVGDICFNYYEEGPSQLGNVIYNVKEDYRHNHYCTRALSLLKKLLKSNNYNGDKSLYLATINEYSIAVAKANGGTLYEGTFKDDYECDLFDDGILKEEQNDVTMFKINI